MLREMTVLFAYASARELSEPLRARLSTGFSTAVEIGVGIARAGVSTAQALASSGPDVVCLFGVAGAYAGAGLAVGDVCIVDSTCVADEGVEVAGGFLTLSDLGLVTETELRIHDAERSRAAASVLDAPRVAAATVNACAGVDELAQRRAATGVSVETMESAAVAFACRAFDIPLVEVRVISNFCGDRDRAGWDLDGAVERLGEAVLAILAAEVLAS